MRWKKTTREEHKLILSHWLYTALLWQGFVPISVALIGPFVVETGWTCSALEPWAMWITGILSASFAVAFLVALGCVSDKEVDSP